MRGRMLKGVRPFACQEPPAELGEDFGDCQDLLLLDLPVLGGIFEVAPRVAADAGQFLKLGQPDIRPRQDGDNAFFDHSMYI